MAREAFRKRPGQSCGSSGDESVDHRERGRTIGFERRTGIEAEPADPQQAGADQRHRQRMRSDDFLLVTEAFAEQETADQRRNTGVDMADGTAGEIESAHIEQKAIAPPTTKERPEW